jgi:protein tyrosine/serine phosphatase
LARDGIEGTTDEADGSAVYVHCQRGADRTGTLCAAYRMVVQGWTHEQALQEMTQGGFGFYQGWRELVEYVRSLNVEQIRDQAGLRR